MQKASLYRLLSDSAQQYASKTALLDESGLSISYQQLHSSITHLRRKLFKQSVESHHRVGIIMDKGTDLALWSLATMSHAICIPINPDYTADELKELFEQLKPDMLLIESGRHINARQTSEQLQIPVMDADVALLQHANQPTATPDTDTSEQWIDGPPGQNNTALILLTSGSTSAPKMVPLNHRNIITSGKNLVESLSLKSSDRCLNMMPLFHIGGLLDLLIAPLSVGGSVICTTSPDSKTFWQCMNNLAPTWYQGVPAMLHDILLYGEQHCGNTTHQLRLIRSVSSALSSELQAKMEQFFNIPVIEIYGMTEACGLIASNPLPPEERPTGSVGLPCGTNKVTVIDNNGSTCPAGTAGEIAIRGDNVMAGYISDAGTTARQAFIGKWFKTGDYGYMDDQGYLYLTGRLNEIINRGGEKIAPQSIDYIAQQHPAVKQAAAFAMPHPTLGQEVAIAIVPYANQSIDEGGLLDFLKPRLAGFKIPRKVHILESLPTGASGKLQRHKLPEFISSTTQHSPITTETIFETPLTHSLSRLWKQVLGIETISVYDNFFDLGGDSLKASTLIDEINKKRTNPVPLYLLYDEPSIAGFEKALRQYSNEQNDSIKETANGLPLEALRNMQSFVSTWHGTRRSDNSLLVGNNITAPGSPLFWGVNSEKEWRSLCHHKPGNRPLYALRALYKKAQSSHNTAACAMHYVDEILEIQPQGPYWIGGFCEAGKIAFDIAVQLQDLGHEVALLCLQEQFVAKPYQGNIAMFFCEPSRRSPLYFYAKPQRGWKKYYSGPLWVQYSAGKHTQYYVSKHFPLFIRQLEEALTQAEKGTLPDSLSGQKKLEPVSDQATNAHIQSEIPSFWSPGSARSIIVTITNTSLTTWNASHKNGLIIGCRWLNPRGAIRSPLISHTELSEPLHPGMSKRIELTVTAPQKSGFRVLDIDVIDDGVCWFQNKSNKHFRVSTTIMPGASLINRLLKLFGKGKNNAQSQPVLPES